MLTDSIRGVKVDKSTYPPQQVWSENKSNLFPRCQLWLMSKEILLVEKWHLSEKMSFTTEQLTLRTEESGRKRAKAHPGGVRNIGVQKTLDKSRRGRKKSLSAELQRDSSSPRHWGSLTANIVRPRQSTWVCTIYRTALEGLNVAAEKGTPSACW